MCDIPLDKHPGMTFAWIGLQTPIINCTYCLYVLRMYKQKVNLACFRAASAQQELEGSVNGLKKETGAQLRELASDRGEALRALEGAKQAAEHRQHQLQVHPLLPACMWL